MIKYIPLFMLLTACGEEISTSIDPEAEVYYQEFIAYSQAFGRDVSHETIVIQLVDETPTVRGIQTRAICKGKTVSLSRKFWPSMSDDHKRLLIYHELGHCLLGLDHSPNPYSIMAGDTRAPLSTFKRNKEALVADLFATQP